MRKPFLLGLIFGAIIGALATLNWWYIQRARPAPTPSTVVPVSTALIPINPAPPAAQSQPVPPGAIPFEFNGKRFYWVPLDIDPKLSA